MFHILVVDDDKHTRKLLRAVLENAHYTVTTATNGEEALEALDKEHIDLVVLDIMMPKMDGYEFTRFVRETDNALPILMVTAKHLPADEKKGFLVGTDDYITKPIDEEKLLLRIKALLRRAQIVSEQKTRLVMLFWTTMPLRSQKMVKRRSYRRRNLCSCISCFLIPVKFSPVFS